jgi:hypothetical protein
MPGTESGTILPPIPYSIAPNPEVVARLAGLHCYKSHLLLGGRLGYHQKNTAGAVFALHAEVERVLDSLIQSLKAKISAKS